MAVDDSTPNSVSLPLNVLIIGAGIAGLSAAIALGKQGHHVVVCNAFLSTFKGSNHD
jgi:2-polyprenyl-6-methoxyphenol hydroxylase-like FAD-dependent oxidoreductase